MIRRMGAGATGVDMLVLLCEVAGSKPTFQAVHELIAGECSGPAGAEGEKDDGLD